MVLHNQGYTNVLGENITRSQWPGKYLSLRLAGDDFRESIKSVQSLWKNIFPDEIFEYLFMDENYNLQFGDDQQLGKIFGIFSVVAVIITSMGLFGLTLYSTIKRTKEIGIRKIVGASVFEILNLLAKDSIILLGISSIIAIAIAYWSIDTWLENFASRIPITLGIFVIPILGVLLIALVSAGWQIIKATRANPVEALKYE